MYGLTVFAAAGHGPERFRRAAGLAADAEAAGFTAVWTGELYNRSATIPMAALAAATERAQIGSCIAYGVGRSPLIWAAEARDLDDLSGGRIILGLGNGTAAMMENWHGVSGQAPAARLEELVPLLRQLWRLDQGPVHHDGRFYRVHVVPTDDVAPPYRSHLPIWTAGVNPAMIRVAARVADGLVGHPMFTAEYVAEVVRPELDAAATQAGRNRDDVALTGILMCSVDPDEEAARRQLAYAIAQYAASRVYNRLFTLHGWSKEQQLIREAARRRDVEAMITAVPDAAIDAIGVACRPGGLAERVTRHSRRYRHLNLVVPTWGLAPDRVEQATRTIIAEMRDALKEQHRAEQ
ncbi:MAG TPA: LLM class flavin-dependent oxidoreductase [Streptosporangiaceae bacterium]|nr:LLM class flavin-dependent oxidoreductase [Streptosporangiaceae bacterium]